MQDGGADLIEAVDGTPESVSLTPNTEVPVWPLAASRLPNESEVTESVEKVVEKFSLGQLCREPSDIALSRKVTKLAGAQGRLLRFKGT